MDNNIFFEKLKLKFPFSTHKNIINGEYILYKGIKISLHKNMIKVQLTGCDEYITLNSKFNRLFDVMDEIEFIEFLSLINNSYSFLDLIFNGVEDSNEYTVRINKIEDKLINIKNILNKSHNRIGCG
tara:strand:+ start:813 stop:1193 length:381 start_codon:yes stop_codon:yes gene_type:complete